MLKARKNVILLGLAAFVLLAGCGIISITITIDEDFDVTSTGDFWYKSFDVTENEDWIEHEDDIEFVELVMFDIWMTNHAGSPITFDAYVHHYDSTLITTRPAFDAATTPVQVLSDIVIPAGESKHLTAGQSLAHIVNLPEMKERALDGQFHIYGTSEGGSSFDFSIDSGKVLITLMVSGP